MLGSDATNTWPGCGEIDIMEYKEVNLIKYMEHHYPAVSPGAGNTN
jgi:hypothetical protein